MAIPSYQDIVALLKKGLTVEAQEKIMELREAALECQNENLALKSNINELKNALALRDSLEWRKPYYVKKSSPDEKFCQRCYDADAKAIRLQELDPATGGAWNARRTTRMRITKTAARRNSSTA